MAKIVYKKAYGSASVDDIVFENVQNIRQKHKLSQRKQTFF